MKNLKILIIAALIGIASVGCGEDGGPGSETPGTTALSGKVGLAEDAQDLLDSAEELLNTYTNVDLQSAADDLATAAEAVDAATTDEELEVAANAVIAATAALTAAAEAVATSEELATLTETVEEFVETAGEIETIEITQIEEEVVEEVEELVLTTVNLLLNSDETCPVDTATEHFICSRRGDLFVTLNSDQSCPADTDTIHFVCTVRTNVDLILNSDETCPTDSPTEHFTCSFRINVHGYVNHVGGDTSTYVCPTDTDTIHYTGCTFRYGNHIEIEYGTECPAPTETNYFICTEKYDLLQFDGMTADAGSNFDETSWSASIKLENGRYHFYPWYDDADGNLIWMLYDYGDGQDLEYTLYVDGQDDTSFTFITQFGKTITILKP